eukprot:401535_1
MSFGRTSRLFSRLKWSSSFAISSYIAYSAIIIEPKTKTKFNDELNIPEYPGSTKMYKQSLKTLGCPESATKLSFAFIKSRFFDSKQFAVGHYSTNNIDSYRIIFLSNMTGRELMDILKTKMI